MGIQDLLLKKMAGFQQALGELYNAKNNLYWEKAKTLIERNYDAALWKGIKDGTAFSDPQNKEALEFQLKLRYHEIDILKATGKNPGNLPRELQHYITQFTAAFPDCYFYELENMKQKLG